jgi:hypothetical protein
MTRFSHFYLGVEANYGPLMRWMREIYSYVPQWELSSK